MPDTHHADPARPGGPDLDDLPVRLAALADRADDFEPPVDPYRVVRLRGRSMRRHRLAGAVAVAAAAVAVVGALTAGTVLPHVAEQAAGPSATPSLPYMKDRLPDDAPALPATGPVGTTRSPGNSLTMKCADRRCPVLLDVASGRSSAYYRLPDQPGTLPLKSTSLSEDGRWLSYHVDGRAVLRNLVTGTTYPLPAGTALTAWEPHVNIQLPGTPEGPALRWALVSGGGGTYRLDLTNGTSTRYNPADAARDQVLGVLPDGDLLVATATGDTTNPGDVLLRCIDPATSRSGCQLTVPRRWGYSGLAGTPAPDGRHAVLTGVAATGSGGDGVLLVDLTTGAITPYGVAELAGEKDGEMSDLAGATWTPLGFLATGEQFTEQAIDRDGKRYQVALYLAAAGTDHASLTLSSIGFNNDSALYLTLVAGQVTLAD